MKEPSKNIPLWLYKELEEWIDDNISTEDLKQHVARVIEQKRTSEGDRLIYTESKNPNRTKEDRETLRQIYLDRRGIPQKYRWQNENN